MPQPKEIELKLEVSAACLGRLKGLSFLKGVKPEEAKTLVSVYFDTDKHDLRKSGLSLRVRGVDGQHIQTIKKQRSRSVGLFDREEWECNVASGRPDLDAAHGTALEPLLSRKARRHLKPVFETRVRRQIYPIHRKGSKIEITVDKGQVKAGNRSSPVCEIELELKEGDTAPLFELARGIARTLPARLACRSKAEHGYGLLAGEQPGPVKAVSIALRPETDWAQAFRVIARACLYQLAANEAALLRNDSEAVHQMRIGLRRLRAAISVFKDMLKGAETLAIKSELKWLTEELGPARELDVFMKRVNKAAKENGPNKSGFNAIIEDFSKRRARALDQARQAVASARFRKLILDISAWIEIGDWIRKDDELSCTLRDRPVADAAAEELSRRRRKIRKAGKRLAALEARPRHKLRIKGKKLRYATEFFASVFPGKKPGQRRDIFVVKLKELQDALGVLNDIKVHEGLMRNKLREGQRPPTKELFAAGQLFGSEGARFDPVMKDAERAYTNFARARPFWPQGDRQAFARSGSTTASHHVQQASSPAD
jgi:triphosphatase